MLTALLPSLLLACGPGGVDIHDSEDTADTADTADTGPDETGDTGIIHGEGMAARSGVAVATLDTLEGVEDWTLLDAQDEVLCRVSSTITATAVRSDCELCAWAFDLVLSATEELSEGTCATYGFVPAQLDGQTRSYGYVPDYFGHAQVIMEDLGGGWDAQGYADWDEATGDCSWYFDDGEISF